MKHSSALVNTYIVRLISLWQEQHEILDLLLVDRSGLRDIQRQLLHPALPLAEQLEALVVPQAKLRQLLRQPPGVSCLSLGLHCPLLSLQQLGSLALALRL